MRFALLALSLSLTTACVEDVGEGKVAATVEDVKEAPAPTEAAAGATHDVDASKGQIKALGAKISAVHPIVFHEYSGKVTVDGDTLTAVSFEVKMDSLESDAERLTGHLKNEDFFDVPNHPTSTFKSVSVAAGSETEGATHTVSGDLTIRGTTKRVSFPATVAVTAGEVKASAEFVINRQDFKVTYPGRPDDLVQDNVAMTIELVAPRS